MTDKWKKTMDEAIGRMQQKVIDDSFCNGSYVTEHKIYRAVKQRLDDLERYIPVASKSQYTAMRAGVLADILDAGKEVRDSI